MAKETKKNSTTKKPYYDIDNLIKDKVKDFYFKLEHNPILNTSLEYTKEFTNKGFSISIVNYNHIHVLLISVTRECWKKNISKTEYIYYKNEIICSIIEIYKLIAEAINIRKSYGYIEEITLFGNEIIDYDYFFLTSYNIEKGIDFLTSQKNEKIFTFYF